MKLSKDIWLMFGIVVIAFIICFVGIGFDKVNAFFDWPSVYIVFGITLGGLFASYGFRSLQRSIDIAGARYADNSLDARKACDAFSFGVRISIVAGLIGVLIGSCNMLINRMSELDVMLSGFEVGLLVIFWSLLVVLFFWVAGARAKVALEEVLVREVSGELVESPAVVNSGLGFYVLIAALFFYVFAPVLHVAFYLAGCLF